MTLGHPSTRPLRRSRTFAAAALCALLALTAAACSEDKSKDTTTTVDTETSTTEESSGQSAEVVRFNEEVQQQLRDVGCYTGAVDGIVGPHTDAAIIEFQRASGLEVDGEVGPETESALRRDVAEGKKVCDGSSTTSSTASTTTTTPSGAACTAAALLTGLPAEGEQIRSYVCSEGWAAGSLTDGTKFILQAEGGRWYAPSQDPCGSASAGLPPVILEDGCDA